MENLGLALQLMVVGMITVFIILMIVIQLGKWLIQIVNKMASEEVASPKTQAAQSAKVAVDAQTLSVIQAAVAQITGGTGSIKNVERL